MDDAVRGAILRLNQWIANFEESAPNQPSGLMPDGAKDIRAIIEENKRLREALGEIDKYDDGGFCGRIACCALKGEKP